MRLSIPLIIPLILAASAWADQSFPPGVIATGTMGVTNPAKPTMGTAINQTSYSRLLSVNSIDDFCIFAPPTLNNISDSETIEVAWCTKARNNARVIPDGTLTGVSFLKTDYYIQILGYGDFTKLNLSPGDEGGELDPHGATGDGNPVGGNVTSNIGGVDYNFAEWMLFIDYNQFCIRVCTNANSTYDAAHMCWHELDEMGCEFNMPGNYNFNGTFETCDADVAYPPGWYPIVASGTTTFSTFAQRFTYTANGSPVTIGDTVTPQTVAFTPSSSNCKPTSTISNGIALTSLGLSGTPTPTGSTTNSTPGASNTGGSNSSNSPSNASPASNTGGSNTSNSPSPSNTNSPSAGVRISPTKALFILVASLMLL